MSLTPISHYLGVDIFEDEHGAKVIIINGKRNLFNTNVRVCNFISHAHSTDSFVARAGQLISE